MSALATTIALRLRPCADADSHRRMRVARRPWTLVTGFSGATSLLARRATAYGIRARPALSVGCICRGFAQDRIDVIQHRLEKRCCIRIERQCEPDLLKPHCDQR